MSYKTYKRKYAVILQAVCDSELVFTDCFAGYPGSVGDIRVFRNSDLWSEVQKNRQIYFPNEEYIIGDKAYPVLRWCISAFCDRGNLTEVNTYCLYIQSICIKLYQFLIFSLVT